jgi:formamidopyrimidine-DNA glycosylase
VLPCLTVPVSLFAARARGDGAEGRGRPCAARGAPERVARVPELPEVETMRRGLLPVVGSRIVGATRPRSTLRPMTIEPAGAGLARRLVGRRVAGVSRLAKRVIIDLDSGDRLAFEPRMTGLVLLADPPTTTHVRLVLDLEGGPAAKVVFWDQRGLGTIRLHGPGELEAWADGRIGPDALTIDAATLEARLGRRRKPVKVALLDQAALAGVGNIYAVEALHRAKVDPRRTCDRLAPAEWRALARALRSILEAAIEARGSTLSDRTYRTAASEEGGFQSSHRVYDRAEQPCRSCRQGTIARIVQAQRSTYYCAACQR